MIVNRAEEQVLSSPARRAIVAKAVAEAVERFCAVRVPLDDSRGDFAGKKTGLLRPAVQIC